MQRALYLGFFLLITTLGVKVVFYSNLHSASNARLQGLLDSFCGSSPVRWAILQQMCSQARIKLQEELTQKLSSKPCDRAIDALCSLTINGKDSVAGKIVLLLHV